MALPYDPVKAHEYYVKNRVLKGRRKAGGAPIGRPSLNTSTYKVNLGNQSVNYTKERLAQEQAYIAQRVEKIKGRLSELTGMLKEMRFKARVAEREDKKGPTASEKSKAARESKKYREKHKQELATKQKKETSKKSTSSEADTLSTVAEVEVTINQVKGRLKDAVARQRALASATKTR